MADACTDDMGGSVHVSARFRKFIRICCTVRSIHSVYVTVHECWNGRSYYTMRHVCVCDVGSMAS